VFVGGWDLAAAEAVCGSDALALLETLIDASMVQPVDADTLDLRFTMLETMREYAVELLAAMGETAAVQRHAAFYTARAEESSLALKGPQQRAWFLRMVADHGNLRAALRWSLDGGDPILGLQLVGALDEYWEQYGHMVEARDWLALALDRASTGPPLLRARALLIRALVWNILDDYNRAITEAEAAIALYEAHGDTQGVGWGLLRLFLPHRKLGNVAQAEQALAAAEALFQQPRHPYALAWVDFYRGVLAQDQAYLETAWDYLTAARAALLACGDQFWAAWGCYNLGHIARFQGRYVIATAEYEAALAIFQQRRQRWQYTEVFICLGHLAREQGDYRRAQQIYTWGLRELWALGIRRHSAHCLDGLGAVAAAAGQGAMGAQLLGSAAALRAAIRLPVSPAERPTYDQLVADVRAASDPATFAAAWAAGQALPIEQAIALALGADP
jgi:tetratricopeptide (TPR) repeat protein